jgi:thioredoxin 1
VEEVTDATFAGEVLASADPVIVHFSAPWCRPCDAIEPHLLAISEERGVRLVKLDIDASIATPARYGVLALPTVIVFAGGEPRATIFGVRPRKEYERALEESRDP